MTFWLLQQVLICSDKLTSNTCTSIHNDYCRLTTLPWYITPLDYTLSLQTALTLIYIVVGHILSRLCSGGKQLRLLIMIIRGIAVSNFHKHNHWMAITLKLVLLTHPHTIETYFIKFKWYTEQLSIYHDNVPHTCEFVCIYFSG